MTDLALNRFSKPVKSKKNESFTARLVFTHLTTLPFSRSYVTNHQKAVNFLNKKFKKNVLKYGFPVKEAQCDNAAMIYKLTTIAFKFLFSFIIFFSKIFL